MNKTIGHLKNIEGKSFAKDAAGNLREIYPGEPVYEGEIIVDASGNVNHDALRGVQEDAGIDQAEHDINVDAEPLEDKEKEDDYESKNSRSTTSTDVIEQLKGEIEVNINASLSEHEFTHSESPDSTSGGGNMSVALFKAENSVYESGLSDGTRHDDSNSVSGHFTMHALMGFSTVSVDGGNGATSFTEKQIKSTGNTPLTIDTGEGIFVIDGYTKATDGTITLHYTYTLKDNLSHPADDTVLLDTITFTVTAKNGDVLVEDLEITIFDDQPMANLDSNEVREDDRDQSGYDDGDPNTTIIAGDVYSNDISGADGPSTLISAHSVTGNTDGSIGTEFYATYGWLMLNSDGTYTYAVDNTNVDVQRITENETLREEFTYTVQDTDGDISTSTLSITIHGTGDVPLITAENSTVHEEALPSGSNPSSPEEQSNGTIEIQAKDGLDHVTIGGTVITETQLITSSTSPISISTAFGTLVIDGFTPVDPSHTDGSGIIHYTYDLTSNTTTHTQPGEDDVLDAIPLEVVNRPGTSSTAMLNITIVDDVPTANADRNSVIEDGTANPITGNVFGTSGVSSADVADSLGADETTTPVSLIHSDNTDTDGTVGSPLSGQYGTLTLNNNGTYSYTLDNSNSDVNALNSGETLTETYLYTISDKDGDTSTSSLEITINGANDAPVAQAQTDTLMEDNIVDDHVDGTVDGWIEGNTNLLTGASDVDNVHTLSIGKIEGEESTVGQDISRLMTYTDQNGQVQQAEIHLRINADGTYVVQQQDINFLPVGQSGTVEIKFNVIDDQGAFSIEETFTLTMEGENDAPVAVTDGTTAIAVNNTGTDGVLSYDSRNGNTELFGGKTSVDVSLTISASSPGSNSLLSYASEDYSNGGNEFLLYTNDAGNNLSVYINGANRSFDLGSSIYDGSPHTIKVSWESATGTTMVFVDNVSRGSSTLAQGHVLGSNGVLMLGQEQDTVGGGLSSTQIFSGEYHDVSITTNGTEVAHWEMDRVNAGLLEDSVGSFDLSVSGDVLVQQYDPLLSMEEDVPLIIDSATLLVNDTDVDGAAREILSVQNAEHGSVSFDTLSAEIRFIPENDYHGPAQFTYTIGDGNGGTDTATVYLNVDPVNDAPDAVDDTYMENVDAIAVNTTGTDGALTFDSRGSNPELLGGANSVEVSMTIRGESGSNSLLSYAAPSNNNEFLLFTNDAGTSLGVYIDGSSKSLSLGGTLYDGNEHRLTVSWDSSTGNIEVSVDGVVTDTDTLRQGYTLGTDGVLMFGQEQDSTGGNVDPSQIFSGEYSEVSISTNGTEVAHWEMNEINAGLLEDSIGNFDLTVSGDVNIVANTNPLMTDEDTALTIQSSTLLANDSDTDGDTLTVTSVFNAVNGTVSLDNTTGEITFTPESDFHGDAQFDYTIDDGNAGTDTATVTVKVNSVNDAPVAVDDRVEQVENYKIDVTANHAVINVGRDSAFDLSTAFTISQEVNITGSGILFNKENAYEVAVFSGGSIMYALQSPSGAWQWNDTGYDIAFDQDHVVTAVYNGANTTFKLYVDGTEVSSNTQNVPNTLHLQPNNDLLFGERGINNQSLEGTFDDILIYDRVLSDTEVQMIAANGTVSNGLVAHYDFEGASPLSDISGNGHDAILQNGASIITSTEGPTEDIAFMIEADTLLVNDHDVDDDTFNVSSVQDAVHGTVVMDGSANITFTPEADYYGDASFSYTISDGNGGSDTATVNFTIQSVNDLPVITVQSSAQLDEDNSITIPYSVTDIEDGTVSSLVVLAAHGTVTVNGDDTFTYTPEADYSGSETIVFTATDSHGAVSNTNIAITVNAVNDAPLAVDDSQIGIVDHTVDVSANHAAVNAGNNIALTDAFTVSQDINVTGSGIIFNRENAYEIAVENDGSLRYAIRASDNSGWVWNDTGYDLALNSEHNLTTVYSGTDNTLKVYVDGTLVSTSTANVPDSLSTSYDNNDLLFGERGNNNQPIEGTFDNIRIYDRALSDTEVQTIATNGTVTNGLVAHYDFEGSDPLGDKSGNGNDATLQNGALFVEVFEDGSVGAIETDEDTALTFDANALVLNDSDIDGDTLNVTAVTATTDTHGTVVLNGDDTITYTPDANYNGTVEFSYTVSDGNGGSDTANVILSVNPVNDLPTVDTVRILQPPKAGMVFWYDFAEGSDDKSGNNHTASEVGTSGIYTTADDAEINTGSYQQKTIAASFTTAGVNASDPLQVIYEQGGAVNGYSISMVSDHLYASLWGESFTEIDPDYAIIDLGAVNANTSYNLVMVHDATATGSGTFTAYLDGVQNPDIKSGVGEMGGHSGDVGIGGYDNNTIDPTNPTANVSGNGGVFQGSIGEVFSWNSASVTTEINNYFMGDSVGTAVNIDAKETGIVELFDVDASDVEDGTTLSYTLQNNHNGLFLVDGNGIVSINADGLYVSKTYDLQVEVIDSNGGTSLQDLSVTVEGKEVVHLNMNGDLNDSAFSGSDQDNAIAHNGAVTDGDKLILDGIDDYVEFANSSDINQGIYEARSVSLWFKTSEGAGTQYIYAEGGGVRSLQIYTENGVLKAKGYNDPADENNWDRTNPTILDTNIDVADGLWHHVVITTAGDPNDPLHGLAADGFKIYLDGTAEDSGTGGALYGHANAYIGSNYNGANTFNGEIDGFRLYNEVLPADQVNELSRATVIDGIVAGLYYETSGGLSGYTDAHGNFEYRTDESVTFKIGDLKIGTIETDSIEDGKVFLQDIAAVEKTDLNDEYVENMVVLLQSLDENSDAYDGIMITEEIHDAFLGKDFDLAEFSEEELRTVIEATGREAVSEESAMEHVQDMLVEYGDMDENDFDERIADEEEEGVPVLGYEIVESIDMSALSEETFEKNEPIEESDETSETKEAGMLVKESDVSVEKSSAVEEDERSEERSLDLEAILPGTNPEEGTFPKNDTVNTASKASDAGSAQDPTVLVTVDEQVVDVA